MRLPRHHVGPSGARPRLWNRLLGGVTASRPCHRVLQLGHRKVLDVMGALGHGDPEVSLPISPTAGLYLAILEHLGSRRHCHRRPVSFGPSLWPVDSLRTLMMPERGENQKCSLSVSVSPLSMDDSTP